MTNQLDRLTSALADRYAIEHELGAGGMATVYLAEDLRHHRRVAVKVLRPELAAVLGAERFVQEITTTANLQHPHILPLFDSGEADSFLYYVMPFIDGETLRGKLNRETQLGVEDAVRIASEVADALDYAHRQDVIHRDIKPENILLHDGRAMVADFGIALAVSAAAGGRMTETGLSLGTPHYMSPEQATAEKELTNRSDIYSLGAVLYEMLTGDPPHTGSSAQQIIMRIVTDDARPITDVRKSVPQNVAGATAKSLEKLPADRFVDAAGFARALADPSWSRDTRMQATDLSVVSRWAVTGWVIGFLGLAMGGWGILGVRTSGDPSREARYLNIVLPDSAPLAFIGAGTLGAGHNALALTPDGRILVYAARVAGVDQLYRRDLTDGTASPMGGTAGAFEPFVSPDGEWVGFFVGAELRKIPIRGGESVRLASTPEAAGASWGTDGRILVSMRVGSQLAWVPESGGPVEEVPNPQSLGRSRPHVLPDGRHALVEIRIPPPIDGAIGVVDLETGRTVAITANGPVVADSVERSDVLLGMTPGYLDSGHLVYSVPAGLVAIAFDPVNHSIDGRPVDVASGVRREGMGVQYVAGADGTLFYAGGSDANVGELAWAARDGSVESLGFAPQWYGTFELSPDGQRVAAVVFPEAGTWEIWVYDLRRGTTFKVATRDMASMPRWWPDGRRLVFTETSSRFPYPRASVRQLVESSGERDTIAAHWEITDLAPDMSRAVGTIGTAGSDRRGVWIFPLDDDQDPVLLDPYPSAWGPTFSPDGRWIAYTSNESGRYEVYVSAADEPGARETVSLAGGEEPVWSPLGDELIYRWGQEWYAAAIPRRPGDSFGRPRLIFQGPYVNVGWRSHDVAADGRRHLVVLGPIDQTTDHISVITNWADDVVRRVGR